MTEDEWGALVGRLEVKAFENPVEMADERRLQGGMLSGIELECWIVYLDRGMQKRPALDEIPDALVFER